MRPGRIRPRGAAAAAGLTAMCLALFGCASQSGTARQKAGSAGFGWFHPGPAPGAWLRASLSGHGATLSYPGSLRPEEGDHGTLTFGSTARSGAVLVYLNVTPRQGDETLRDWPGFRLEHLRADGQSAVHLDAISGPLNFRGGRGRCITDNYTTGIRHNSYHEIACIVRGPHATSVLVAAASTATWRAHEGLLEKVVSSYQAT